MSDQKKRTLDRYDLTANATVRELVEALLTLPPNAAIVDIQIDEVDTMFFTDVEVVTNKISVTAERYIDTGEEDPEGYNADDNEDGVRS